MKGLLTYFYRVEEISKSNHSYVLSLVLTLLSAHSEGLSKCSYFI